MKKVISCGCLKKRNYNIEYCTEDYPLSYFYGKYNIVNDKGVTVEQGTDNCPYCGKKIEVSECTS